ncbi:hypothetical protein Sjap_023435 [Stephania japonica]|uniref:Uncharacterized protein n=1 Tax=Stephania japonica TaxID=461633 RepID=A0AAP0EGT9_9MAGN
MSLRKLLGGEEYLIQEESFVDAKDKCLSCTHVDLISKRRKRAAIDVISLLN